MNKQPTLQNDLVIIRPLKPEDKESLYSAASDPLIWEQHQKPDRWQKESFDLFFSDSIQSQGALVIIDKASSAIIGSSRFNDVSSDENAVEIGWSFLARNYWGGEYNKAFKKLMLDHAFEQVASVYFYIHKDNLRSQKATKKLKAQRVDDLLHESNKKDSLTFVLEKKNWIKN